MADLLGHGEIENGLRDLDPGWSATPDGLKRSIEFASFLDAVHFIDMIAPHCEELNHHPDLCISWRTVNLTLITHSAKGVTGADLGLAFAIDKVANQIPKAD